MQVNDIGADRVQEDAVVGDDDHGLVILVQVLLQPHDSGKVEVVGGLIKQQYVRLQEQGTCNGNPGEDKVWGNFVLGEYRAEQSRAEQKGSSFTSFASLHCVLSWALPAWHR